MMFIGNCIRPDCRGSIAVTEYITSRRRSLCYICIMCNREYELIAGRLYLVECPVIYRVDNHRNSKVA